MAEQKRESSVLFSLRELRKIEEDRVQQEKDAQQQKIEDERNRVLAEEQRVRDEAERARREVAAAEKARLDEEDRRRREDELRLAEASEKARVDAQARLEEQRLRMEIDARAKANSTRKAKVLVSASVGMAVIVAGLGVYAWKANSDREETKRLTQLAIVKKEEAINELLRQRDAEATQIAAMQAQTAKDVEELKATQDAAEQQRIRDRIDRRQREIAAAAERERAIREAAEARRRAPVKINNCKNPNDPLCGL
jgi:hypothetical protein